MAKSVKRAVGTERVAIPDPVFFTKDQITVGTILRYVGRLNPNSEWLVTGIKTFDARQKRHYKVQSVQRLNDDVYLRNRATGENYTITFGYASYSAIWRLA